MGLEYRPDFSLSVDDGDITASIQPYFVSISLTDNSGEEADRLSISLALPASFKTPPKGASLRLGLGFNGDLIDKGKFVVDEVLVSGPPRVVQIVAQSAPMDNTKSASTLQSQKMRSWHDVTLGEVLKTVANDHGLVPKISADLSGVSIGHIDQSSESDLNLMMRLSRRYGAVSKPANGYWLFLKEGEGKSASGKALTEVTLRPHQVTTYQVRSSSRSKSRRVTALYIDHESGTTKEVSAGFGEPEFRIAFPYPNRDEALARATAQAKSSATESDTISLTLPATQDLLGLVAESHVIPSGFGDLEDVRWKVKALGIVLDTGGMRMSISGIGEM
jgi:phage protein D